MKEQEAQVALVAPVWKSQGWYPVLLRMLTQVPLLIPPQEGLILPTDENNSPAVIPQLAVWVI